MSSGEQSGSLDIMLRRLAEFLEKVVKLKAQVKQAMTYPLAILIFSVVVTIFMLWKVVPVFSNIFLELGANLPFLTSIIVVASEFIQKYIMFIFFGLIGFIILFKYLKRTDAGRKVIDRGMLKITWPDPSQGGQLR